MKTQSIQLGLFQVSPLSKNIIFFLMWNKNMKKKAIFLKILLKKLCSIHFPIRFGVILLWNNFFFQVQFFSCFQDTSNILTPITGISLNKYFFTCLATFLQSPNCRLRNLSLNGFCFHFSFDNSQLTLWKMHTLEQSLQIKSSFHGGACPRNSIQLLPQKWKFYL